MSDREQQLKALQQENASLRAMHEAMKPLVNPGDQPMTNIVSTVIRVTIEVDNVTTDGPKVAAILRRIAEHCEATPLREVDGCIFGTEDTPLAHVEVEKWEQD